MSDKKIPPPPSLPPNLEIKTDFCLLHKGSLKEEKYSCVTCKTEYCLECAKKAKAEGKSCVKCKQLLFI